MVDLLKAVVLGTIQGLTEFLPISSSAHLRIYPELFGWGDPGAAFTAVIQIGTELAVLIYFRKDIWRIATMWLRSLVKPEYRGHLDARMGWFIIIGSLPIVILGVLLKDVIERDFRNLWIIGTTLIVLGIVLGIADRFGVHRQGDQADHPARRRADGRRPGTRAGARGVAVGRHAVDGPLPRLQPRGRDPLRLPAGDPGRGGRGPVRAQGDPDGDNTYGWGPTIVATVVSFVVGYAAIAWLLRYVTTKSYTPFVLYRVAPRRRDADPGRRGRAQRLTRRAYSQPDFLNH